MTIICADCGRAIDGPHLCQRTAPACTCFAPGGGRHAGYCATVDRELVPGWLESAVAQADVADQKRWDGAR